MRVTPLIGNKILLAPNDDDRDQVKAFERMLDLLEAEGSTAKGIISTPKSPHPIIMIGPKAELERIVKILEVNGI